MRPQTGKQSTRRRARAATSALLGGIGCLLCVVSLVAVWGRNQVLETDRYMASVAPLAGDPVIQDEVATKVAAAINSRLDAASLAREVLPERAEFLAAPLGDAVEDKVDEVTRDFVASSAFVTLWTELNLVGHQELVAVLKDTDAKNVLVADGRLKLDLSRVVEAVRDRLEAVGLNVVTRLPPITLVVDVADAEGVEDAQDAVALLDRAANLLPVVSLGLLAASVVAARRRRRSIALVAAGLTMAMTAFVMLLRWGPSVAADHVPASVAGPDAVRAYYGHLTSLLYDGALTVGLLAAGWWVVAALWRSVATLNTAGGRSPASLVASEARFLVPIAVVVTLLLWQPPGPWAPVLLTLIASALYLALRHLSPAGAPAVVVAPAP